MGNEEVLLKEYETCQQNINSTTSRYWITVGIFIGMNTALWAAIAYKATSAKFAYNINWEWMILPILVTVFGLVMIFIIYCLRRWLDRVNWLTYVKYSRMREIEAKLDMRANTYIDALDNWDELSEEQRTLGRLDELHSDSEHQVQVKERIYLHRIYKWLIAVWVSLILMSWLFPLLIFNLP